MIASAQHDGLYFEVAQQYNKHAPVIPLTDSVAFRLPSVIESEEETLIIQT